MVGLGLKTRREGGERERSARGKKGGVRDVCMMSAACWIEVVRPAKFNPG